MAGGRCLANNRIEVWEGGQSQDSRVLFFQKQELPITTQGWKITCGDSVIASEWALDLMMTAYIALNNIPSGTLAVLSGDGRLVHAKGYTNTGAYEAAQEETFLTCPESQFRIASVSKLLTAVGVMQLVEDGKLSLTDTVNDLQLFDHQVPALMTDAARKGARIDSFVNAITVHHLLTHTSGIYDDNDPPPIYLADPTRPMAFEAKCWFPAWYKRDSEVVSWTGATLPLSTYDMLQCVNSSGGAQPGQWWWYSNHNYMLLSRLMELVGGSDYETTIRDRILNPLGMDRTKIGSATVREPYEVPYYHKFWPWVTEATLPDEYKVSFDLSVMDPARPMVYRPRGVRNIAASTGGSGWISTAVDLARFARDLFQGSPSVISQTTLDQMIVRQKPSGVWDFVWRNADQNPQGIGFKLDYSHGNESYDRYDRWHTGHLDGTQAFFYNFAKFGSLGAASNASLVFLFNRHYDDFEASTTSNEQWLRDALLRILEGTTDWGTDDLFGSY